MPLAAGPNHTLVGVVTPMPSVDLEPKGTYTTPVTISSVHRDHQVGPQDSLTVSAELLAQGYGPLQRTGVEAHATLRR
ncbi:hypothetical protein [Streptomyces sp. NPDC088249]|uniref:hypothetical protein n=1 Tax=Streptomyces sp. NPDC088249 TaxID=3365843 RepID=UPI0037F59472